MVAVISFFIVNVLYLQDRKEKRREGRKRENGKRREVEMEGKEERRDNSSSYHPAFRMEFQSVSLVGRGDKTTEKERYLYKCLHHNSKTIVGDMGKGAGTVTRQDSMFAGSERK